jgi:hypothetical protein
MFSCFFVGKARAFSTNPVRNSHYKYQLSSFRISRSECEEDFLLRLDWVLMIYKLTSQKKKNYGGTI